MMLKELVTNNRSYRRFFEDVALPRPELEELIELARLSPSSSNLQPLKYFISNTPDLNLKIFENLAWAGYLPDWKGPEAGERPSAYIVILQDKRITAETGCDHGIAAQSIMLGAAEKGWGGCMIRAVKREALRKALALPGNLLILLVLALGKPKEKVVIDSLNQAGDIKYWRDRDTVHHVPKRPLTELIVDSYSREKTENF
jgi:nitroreductase